MNAYEILPIFDRDNGAQSEVLTVNSRLALELSRAYQGYQQQLGRLVWHPPLITPLTQWLQAQYEKTDSPKPLMSAHQEQLLWEKIIADQHPDLLQIQATAQLAQQAWQHAKQWNVSLVDTEFWQWASAFEAHCAALNLQPQATITQQLIDANFNTNNKIYLYGFDEIPPSLMQLFAHLGDCEILNPLTHPNNACFQYAANDREQEWQDMAQWAKAKLEQNPRARIACIIPELAQSRDQIEEIFTTTLELERIIPGTQTPKKCVNISAPQPLSSFPLIQTAIQILKLAQPPLSSETLFSVLSSPYTAQHEDDQNIAALIDIELRQTTRLDSSELFEPVAELFDFYPRSTLLARWRTFLKTISELPEMAYPSQWLDHFAALWHAIGFPGLRNFNSLEYQLENSVLGQLEHFATLDKVTGRISFHNAQQLFAQQLNAAQFQPEGSEAPIQILGILESAGAEYDACWIANLNDTVWPAKAKPNPLLPYALQVKHQMPHAHPTKELRYSQTIIERLKQCAKEVIFSYAKADRDEILYPSPLIKNFASIERKKLFNRVDSGRLANMIGAFELETFVDDHAPPINDKETVQGGSRILKSQALCPFQAFATIRLNAQGLAPATRGMAQTTRGILVHDVLDRIWQRLSDHRTLISLTTSALQTLIQEIIQQCLNKHSNYLQLPDILLKLEVERLTRLVRQWLELEKQRPPFKVVQREHSQRIKIGPLKLTVRIDRVDEIADQQKMIIDYKTGMSQLTDWFSDRPLEPQLPMYCSYTKPLDNKPYVALSFAQVHPKKMTFNGLISDHCQQEKISGMNAAENWAELVQDWRHTLEQLSTQFYQGHAKVDPIHPQRACLYCELQPLCRIALTTRQNF